MGLTYKENVLNTRDSPLREMAKELKDFEIEIYGHGPLLSKDEIENFGIKALDFSFSTNLFLCGALPHDPAIAGSARVPA
ncbi:MAG: hypothetical protein QMD22_11420, partial [archaeon]|nr:hypothetical protein [archaeon]